MKIESAQIRAALERTRVTSGWPEAAAEEISIASEVRTCADGERVIAAGEELDALWIVTQGSFLLSKSWQNGRRFVYGFLRPGQSTGMLPVFDHEPAVFDVIARGEVNVVVVPGNAMRSATMRYPEVAHQIITYLCRRARMDYDAVELHALNSVRCRIAKAILWIARGQQPVNDREIIVDSRISQEDLADVVCAARQSVNRELRRLMREGILKQRYRTLVILDYDRLLAVAGEDEGVALQVRVGHAAHGDHFYPTTE